MIYTVFKCIRAVLYRVVYLIQLNTQTKAPLQVFITALFSLFSHLENCNALAVFVSLSTPAVKSVVLLWSVCFREQMKNSKLSRAIASEWTRLSLSSLQHTGNGRTHSLRPEQPPTQLCLYTHRCACVYTCVCVRSRRELGAIKWL